MCEPAFDDIQKAASRISRLIHRTPVLTSRLFDQAAGVSCFFKCENLQRGGSFKMRGASNFLLSLSEEQRRRGVVTYSSGNHGQAVAIAAEQLDVGATIVMPEDAPRTKVEATRAHGPRIIFYNRQTEIREAIGQRIAAESGASVLPPYDHAWTIAGQGTAGLELLDQVPELDAIAVPVGGGGLLSGIAIAAKSIKPLIRLFAVEPQLANDWALSFDQGERVQIAPSSTIADGLRALMPGEITFPIVKRLVERVVLVSEEEIASTLRFLLTRLKIVAEPSGAVAAAAALHHRLPGYIGALGILITGGNVDLDQLSEICRGAR
jgi:threonine dehydratase